MGVIFFKPVLKPGLEIILVIDRLWYLEIVQNGYLEAGFDQIGFEPEKSQSAIIVARIVDAADPVGLWITSDATSSPVPGLQIFIPWERVISMATHPDFHHIRTEFGLKAREKRK